MNVSRTPRWLAVAIVMIAATSVLSACSSSGEGTPTLKVISGTVTVQSATGHPKAVNHSVTVDSASTVSTAGSGSIAQLTWSDGSYARLAANSKFVVGTSGAVGTLGRGMIWARAGKTASAFIIRTSSGRVSAGSSSLFIVNCASKCSASDLSGAVKVGKGSLKPLTTAAIVSALPKPTPLRWDSVFGDAFAVKNAALDVSAGFSKADTLYAGASPTLASLTGTFSGPRTINQASCSGPASGCVGIVAGIVAPRTYTFAIDCSAGIPCAGEAVTDVAHAGKADTHPQVALEFDGANFSWGWGTKGPYCKTGTQVSGAQDNELSWTAHATAAGVVNGDFVVTHLSGTATASNVITQKSPTPGCAAVVNVFSSKGVFDVTRQ